MLPPAGEAVLQNNPEFAALYSTLSTAILNPDGTTQDEKSHNARERAAVREELVTHRLVSAKHHLLAQAISSTVCPKPALSVKAANKPVSRSPEISDLLLDLLLLLPPLLLGPEEHPAETLQLLMANAPFSSLDRLMPGLATLVSSSLQSSAVQIARAAFPATNASFVHRQVPSLARRITELSSNLQQQSDALAGARLTATAHITQLLQKQTEALVLLVRSLEVKHCGIARSLEYRAAEVSLNAQLGQLNGETALWDVRKDVYSTEVRRALENYSLHLRDSQVRLMEAMRTAQTELQDYGVGRVGDQRKESALREAAQAHRETRKRIEDAKCDLSRFHQT